MGLFTSIVRCLPLRMGAKFELLWQCQMNIELIGFSVLWLYEEKGHKDCTEIQVLHELEATYLCFISSVGLLDG